MNQLKLKLANYQNDLLKWKIKLASPLDQTLSFDNLWFSNATFLVYTITDCINHLHHLFISKLNHKGQIIDSKIYPIVQNGTVFNLKFTVTNSNHESASMKLWIAYRSYEIKSLLPFLTVVCFDNIGQLISLTKIKISNENETQMDYVLMSKTNESKVFILIKETKPNSSVSISVYQIGVASQSSDSLLTSEMSLSLPLSSSCQLPIFNLTFDCELSKPIVYLIGNDQNDQSVITKITDQNQTGLHFKINDDRFDRATLRFDSQNHLYLLYLRAQDLKIAQICPNGQTNWTQTFDLGYLSHQKINPDQDFWNEDNLICKIDDNNNLIVLALTIDFQIKYLKICQSGELLESYHQTLLFPNSGSVQMKYCNLDPELQYFKCHVITIDNEYLYFYQIDPKVYLVADTYVLLKSRNEKPIQDVKKGDCLSTGAIVKNLCRVCLNTNEHKLLLLTEGCLGNQPNRETVGTDQCLIFHYNEWIKLSSFDHCKRIKYLDSLPDDRDLSINCSSEHLSQPIRYLYNLQLEQNHDNECKTSKSLPISYVANGLEIMGII